MLSAKDVRNIAFSKQVNGYRREEVDVFLDKVESDYEAYERTVRELNAKIHELQTQMDETRNAEGSLQNVLISAQKLADSIVAEAKEKSGKIVEDAKISLEGFKLREKELSDAFDKKVQERKQIARDELDKIIDRAKVSHDKVADATEKTVRKQEELFNRLKLETAAFKAEILEKYKRQIELISRIPDSIPTDPEDIAAAVRLDVTDLNDRENFISSLEQKEVKIPEEESADDDIDVIEDIISSSSAEAPAPQKSTGFTVNAFADDEEN